MQLETNSASGCCVVSTCAGPPICITFSLNVPLCMYDRAVWARAGPSSLSRGSSPSSTSSLSSCRARVTPRRRRTASTAPVPCQCRRMIPLRWLPTSSLAPRARCKDDDFRTFVYTTHIVEYHTCQHRQEYCVCLCIIASTTQRVPVYLAKSLYVAMCNKLSTHVVREHSESKQVINALSTATAQQREDHSGKVHEPTTQAPCNGHTGVHER